VLSVSKNLASLGAALAIAIGAAICLPLAADAAPLSRNGGIAFWASLASYDEADNVESSADRVAFLELDGTRRFISEGTEPAFSPDGKLVAVAHIRGTDNHEQPGIVVRRLDGSELTRLTYRGTDRSPTWSPTGRRLAFTRRTCSRSGCQWGVYTIRRDGTGLRRIVRRGWDPTWSAHGTIAYAAPGGEIWATGLRGQRHWRLATRGRYSCGSGSRSPEWSPTGEKLVFARTWRGPTTSLFVVNRFGGGLRRIAGTDRRHAWVAAPTWSPDGRWIAFLDDTGTIYKIHPSGGTYKFVTRAWWDCPSGCPTPLFGLLAAAPDWQPLPSQ
jgi:Tol biopolymer transport system component